MEKKWFFGKRINVKRLLKKMERERAKYSRRTKALKTTLERTQATLAETQERLERSEVLIGSIKARYIVARQEGRSNWKLWFCKIDEFYKWLRGWLPFTREEEEVLDPPKEVEESAIYSREEKKARLKKWKLSWHRKKKEA